jgi:SAM-dependent methyltransferase
MTKGDPYVHGTNPDEQARLSDLNQLINEAALREMKLRGGEKILDLGSGLGQFSRAMARAAGPGGKVIGIERSAEQIEEALRQARNVGEADLVEMRPGDAADPPIHPGEWGSFDVAHARFLLEHVRDPSAVVGHMVRAVRPGGRLILADDDHDILRLWPEPPGVAGLWRAYIRTYDRLGHDPYVGRRLVALLHEAGAFPRRNTWLFFGACSGDPAFPVIVENMARILEGASRAIAGATSLSPGEIARAIAELHSWGGRPDAAFWYGIAWAEGVRE